jgi:predicted SAM-dependent methyltransferase
MRQLNLGCGFDKREGYLNVDHFPQCEPDQLLNIESTPWDLPSNQFDRVLLKHVLEHVGATFDVFRDVMRELYRVTAPGGIIEIQVPHYKHDTWWSDPTHVRAFNYVTFEMMSKKKNDIWIKERANYTMLAYVMDVDFEIVEARHIYEKKWWDQFEQGNYTADQMRAIGEQNWGAIKEFQVELRAVK